MSRLHPYHPTEVGEALIERTIQRTSELRNEISAYAAKQRDRSKRRNAAEPPEMVGPTPERLAKVDDFEQILVPIKDQGTKGNHRATRLQTAYETLKHKLTDADQQNLARAAKDYLDAQAPTAKLISSYGQGTGGSGYGPRAGGVPDQCREAFNRTALLATHLGPRLFEALRDLAFEVRERALQERSVLSPWADRAASKGVTYGLLLACAMVLDSFYRREHALSRTGSTDAEVRMRLQARREAAARRGRGGA